RAQAQVIAGPAASMVIANVSDRPRRGDTTRHARENSAVVPGKLEVRPALLCDPGPGGHKIAPVDAAREEVAGPDALHLSNSEFLGRRNRSARSPWLQSKMRSDANRARQAENPRRRVPSSPQRSVGAAPCGSAIRS